MEITESIEKTVLSYLVIMNKIISLYQFDRVIIYKFGFDVNSGYFIQSFINSGYLRQTNEGSNQMESYEVTNLGRDYVKAKVIELIDIGKKITNLFDELSIVNYLIEGPFCSFNYLGRKFGILILLDGKESKLSITIPTDQEAGFKKENISLDEFLVSQNILKEILKKQMISLKKMSD